MSNSDEEAEATRTGGLTTFLVGLGIMDWLPSGVLTRGLASMAAAEAEAAEETMGEGAVVCGECSDWTGSAKVCCLSPPMT